MQLNPLSFSNFQEFETTKHVHRLHPYKGKFIPQLAEYFLQKYFKPGDIILDPFCGSGTTLVQASEMEIHGVGVDILEFAVFLSNVKIGKYERVSVAKEIINITNNLDEANHQDNKTQIDLIFSQIKKVENLQTKKFLAVILSRVINAKSVNHPVASFWWKKYSIDSLNRILEFERLRTNTKQLCISADARTIDLISEVGKRDAQFATLIQKQKIRGIFTSPPYVGVIDYHEEHADAYELFKFKRKDALEIGPKFKGENQKAREEYCREIVQALQNLKKYLAPDFDIFFVVNDKFNLYPFIAKESGLKIVEKFSRPVLNRTSAKETPYSEKIYHLK